MQSQIILGDNLEVLKKFPSESADLCYIDPPFFSNRNYEVIWGEDDDGEVRSFKDRWSGGIDKYIEWLYERVEQIHRVLKPTGSFYLHCDWHANAYIRVYILDKLFGKKNFVNEIIWRYSSGGASKKFYSRNHDTIYFYAKSKKYVFNPQEIMVQRTDEVLRRIKSGNPNATRAETIDKLPEDIFDIQYINAMAKERIGYPTQKPEALLERIIKASSNEGDVVLDAFCGGGTTCAVARKLNRRFIGIDQSVRAVKVTQARLERDTDLINNAPFSIDVHKYDYETIRNSDAFDFQRFIIEQFGGESSEKQRSDFGIDGKKDKQPIQVKRSENVGRNVVDNFLSAMKRFDKKCKTGYIIAFSFGSGAIGEVARLKRDNNIDIQLIKVEDIIEIAHKPKIQILYTWEDTGNVRKDGFTDKKISFTATNGKAVKIWQWDFNYSETEGFRPTVLFNKDGKVSKIFSSGEYVIAVRATDENGIETTETLKIVVNGKVKTR
ncbi:MAG: hypothetical protein FWE67_13120 [Planctomycetaceae bacterium]|nr:hypothetical protein [Planctomycetaceae bacterium]